MRRFRVPEQPETSGTALFARRQFHAGSDIPTYAAWRIWPRRLGVQALIVDYRVAPGHPFPAPLHDCVKVVSLAVETGHFPHRTYRPDAIIDELANLTAGYVRGILPS